MVDSDSKSKKTDDLQESNSKELVSGSKSDKKNKQLLKLLKSLTQLKIVFPQIKIQVRLKNRVVKMMKLKN